MVVVGAVMVVVVEDLEEAVEIEIDGMANMVVVEVEELEEILMEMKKSSLSQVTELEW